MTLDKPENVIRQTELISEQPVTDEPGESGRLKIGAKVDGRYEVLGHLGSGGMGEVYKVLDTQTKTLFALKMMSPQLAEKKILSKRLEHEAQAARTLVHGNIVSVYDVGADTNGQPYLIMDYVEGEGLDAALKREAFFTSERAIPIFNQIAEALVHAQQKSIVHRDLKPSNILMAKTAEGNDMVKIVDFGIAKVSDQDGANKTKLTQTGELLGTPLYMSPEQCMGEEVDARSDIYSFGCVMYEVLTGKSPFAAENSVKVILKHLNESAPPFSSSLNINSDLKEVVNRCLEKNRGDRYANAVDLHIDLERIANGQKIRPHARKEKDIATKRKSLNFAAVAAGILLMCGVGLWGIQTYLQSSQPAPVASYQRPEEFDGKTLTQWSNEIEKNPDDPSMYFSRGVLHSMRDERSNAIDDFTKAIELKPDYLIAYKQRAQTYGMVAQYDKALNDANKYISLNPESPDGYATRAAVYGMREQYDEALKDWRHAIKLDSSRAWFHSCVGVDLMKLGMYDGSIAAFEKAVAMDGSGYFREPLALAYMIIDKYDLALKNLTLSSDKTGEHNFLMAFYYLGIGKTDEALREVEKGKQSETFPARGFRMSGEFFRVAGQYERAIKEFSAATSLEEYPPGYRQRAITYMNLGQLRSAYADLKKSLELNPFSTITLSYIARVESQLKMPKEADAHIEKAFDAFTFPPIVFVNRAAIEMDKGDLKKALEYADMALQRDKFLKEGYLLRSEIRRKLKDDKGAADDKALGDKLLSHFDR